MKGKTIGIFAAVLAAAMISVVAVSAYQGDYTKVGPNYDEERHELMQEAFETNDYSTWYELMTEDGRNPKVVDVVTEENFARFAEARIAAMNGDVETAKEIRAELGLGLGKMNGQRSMQRQGLSGEGQGMNGEGKGLNGEGKLRFRAQ